MLWFGVFNASSPDWRKRFSLVTKHPQVFSTCDTALDVLTNKLPFITIIDFAIGAIIAVQAAFANFEALNNLS